MKEKLRLGFYLLSLAVGFIGAVLVASGKITQVTADGWASQVAQLAGLLGIAVPAVAGWNLNKQVKQAEHAPATPADMIVTGVDALNELDRNLQASKQRAQDALTGLIQDVPVLGPLAKQAIDRLP